MPDHDLTELRAAARMIFDRAVQAADPARALRRALAAAPFPVPGPGGRIWAIAIGKAAPAMLAEALAHIADPVTALAVTHHDNPADVAGATVLRAGHPVPDADGLRAGQAILGLLARTTAADRVIALVSGGGSALVPAPLAGISLSDKARVNELLLSAGLDIVQMNLVRQQLSALKGGGFLRHAAPAPVSAYILSDVIGDDLRAVASGPTVAPIGTRAEARRALAGAGIWEQMPDSVRTVLVSDAPAAPTPPAANHLIGSNRLSLAAAQAAAANPGPVRIVSDRLTGDVAQAAAQILAAARAQPGPGILLFGGETTVRLTGTGRGGRNQDLALRVALGAAEAGPADWVFLSGGTDGRDGPTDAAGGIVTAGTCARIRAAGGDPAALLGNNDSHHALSLAGDLLTTGATGTNVADIQILLRGGPVVRA